MIVQRYSDFRRVFSVAGGGTDPSGYEAWPASLVLPPPGEPTFSLAMPEELTTSAEITVYADYFDTVPGVDEFDWYLSQRTDAPENQLLVLSRSDNGSATRSGTVQLAPTALATALYEVTIGIPVPSPDDAPAVFRDVVLYVRRRSDGKIMLGTFLEETV